MEDKSVPVDVTDDSTQTADTPVQRKFDPIAIFYDQMSTQPSTREIVAQVRNEMA